MDSNNYDLRNISNNFNAQVHHNIGSKIGSKLHKQRAEPQQLPVARHRHSTRDGSRVRSSCSSSVQQRILVARPVLGFAAKRLLPRPRLRRGSHTSTQPQLLLTQKAKRKASRPLLPSRRRLLSARKHLAGVAEPTKTSRGATAAKARVCADKDRGAQLAGTHVWPILPVPQYHGRNLVQSSHLSLRRQFSLHQSKAQQTTVQRTKPKTYMTLDLRS